MRVLLVLALVIVATPTALAQEVVVVEAQATVVESNHQGLDEVFLTPDLQPPPEPATGHAVWTWWTWSDETNSNWPDDDATHRLRQFNDSTPHRNETLVVSHPMVGGELIDVSGTVKVMSDGLDLRWVALDLFLTPQVNLTNRTILYLVVKDDTAVDVHGRTAPALVRELRPEVGFALSNGTTTNATFQFPADHLLAAGIDLTQASRGWTYAIAVFGGSLENETRTGLLYYTEGRLPSGDTVAPSSERWLTGAVLLVALTVVGTVVTNVRLRERSMPTVHAAWLEDGGIGITVSTGAAATSLTAWSVQPPWRFKKRPPNLDIQPHGTRTLQVTFVSPCDEDCHLDVAMDVAEMGSWQHHVWLQPASPGGTEALKGSDHDREA